MNLVIRLVVLIICGISVIPVYSQWAQPRIITSLPDSVDEASGIEFNNYHSIWVHNDSGDKARIYKTDTTGQLLRTFNLKGIEAIDFEDITQDNKGFYYVADAGNNLSNRQNLKILKFKNPDSLTTDTIIPEIISFYYDDQHLFPPPLSHQNFDCEAMFHFNDSLWLFSKNHGSSTYCRLYKISDIPGDYTAAVIDSFNTLGWITAADISPDKKSAVLLSDSMMWIFHSFSNYSIFNGQSIKLSLPHTQKEGVTFINDKKIMMVDEQELVTSDGRKLYMLDLSPWLTSVNENPLTGFSAVVFPSPATDAHQFLRIFAHYRIPLEITIADIIGNVIDSQRIELLSGENIVDINYPNLLKGLYLMSLQSGSVTTTFKYVR